MNIFDLNRRIFAQLYRVNVNPKTISFPENAAYSLIALLWMLNIMSISFLVMGLLKIRFRPAMIYLFIGIAIAMLVISYFSFLHKGKYKAIIADARYQKSKTDKLLLVALFLGSFILFICMSVLFGKILFLKP